MRALRLIAASLMLPLLLTTSFASAAGFSFTNVIDTTTAAPTGTFDSFARPAISSGAVTFRAQFNSGADSGIFASNGPTLVTIAKTGDPGPAGTLSDFGDPAISLAMPAIVFLASYNGTDTALFGSVGGPPIPIVGTPVVDGFGGDPAVSVDIAYVAYTGGAGDSGVYTAFGSAIVESGDPAPVGLFDEFNGNVAISSSAVAFRGIYGGYTGQGIFSSDGGTLTTIAKTGDAAPTGVFDNFEQSPSIDDYTVAFGATFNSGNTGIFTGDGGALTTIVQSGDPAPLGAFDVFSDPSIDNGMTAFHAVYNGYTANGIFLGDGGALTTVIKTGDSLFGSTVTILEFGHFGLDDGLLAFRYELADGRSGIAIAAATTVPEPTTLALFAIALGLASATRRRR